MSGVVTEAATAGAPTVAPPAPPWRLMKAIGVLAVLGAPAVLWGLYGPRAAMKTVSVDAKQPIAYSHKAHLDYFASGKHRDEHTKMHLAKLRETVPPEELVRGECSACHTKMEETKDCAGCHTLFQDAKLRERKDVRACVGCHRGAWNSRGATVPSAFVCNACHGGEQPITQSPEEKKLRDDYLSKKQDIPWVQLTTLVPHAHSSHKAHVRYAGFSCTKCHDDMTNLTAPPSTRTGFSMDGCVKCHTENHASTDCLACHR